MFLGENEIKKYFFFYSEYYDFAIDFNIWDIKLYYKLYHWILNTHNKK